MWNLTFVWLFCLSIVHLLIEQYAGKKMMICLTTYVLCTFTKIMMWSNGSDIYIMQLLVLWLTYSQFSGFFLLIYLLQARKWHSVRIYVLAQLKFWKARSIAGVAATKYIGLSRLSTDKTNIVSPPLPVSFGRAILFY